MDRKKELLDAINNNITLIPLVEQMVMMEQKLDEIAKLPFYKVNPENPMQQKVLPAFRMYKELLQQYTNCVKTIESEAKRSQFESVSLERSLDRNS